jgi:hypothetical protein
MITTLKKHDFKNSSNLGSMEYDMTTKKLVINFLNGGTYRYSRVPYEDFLKLKRAKSAGKSFNRNVKNFYNFERL